MKSVLISIQPKWCELIASGKKTIEVRKTVPKLQTPFKCYIYCTNSDVHSCLMVSGGETKLIHCCNYKTAIPVGGEIGNGKVIGEFVCDKFENKYFDIDIGGTPIGNIHKDFEQASCLKRKEIVDYILRPNKKRNAWKGANWVYGWNISALKIYDTPKELGEFWKIDKCPYVSDNGCTYNFHCFRAAENSHKYGRCGERLTRPPQSWFYVEA